MSEGPHNFLVLVKLVPKIFVSLHAAVRMKNIQSQLIITYQL